MDINWRNMKMELLKKTTIDCLCLFGLWQLFHRLARHQITIIYMHGIMDAHDYTRLTTPNVHVTPKELEHSLRILNRTYTFISLSQAIQILNSEAPPVKNGLVIPLTGDYHNNHKYGGPLLKNFRILPCLFISTQNKKHCQAFWFDRLDYAIHKIVTTDYRFDIKVKWGLQIR